MEKVVSLAGVRRDFPLLARTMNGKPLAYLDSASTSQSPTVVIDAEKDFYENYRANLHRGIYALAGEATSRFEAARAKVARFVGAKSEKEIVFTRGTTESLNLLAYSWGLRNLRKGDNVVTTIMEHHSNIVPWQLAAGLTGAEVRFVGVEDGALSMDDYERLVDEKTRLVTVAHASNVLGTVNDIKLIGRIAHDAGALFAVDGAQSAPHMPVDVRAIDCDFFAASGHKMLGPTGIGFLYGKTEALHALAPFQGGGGMIKEVRTSGTTFADVPTRFEAGTLNIAGAIGLGAAVDYLEKIGMRHVREHEKSLTNYCLDALAREAGVTVYGPSSGERVGVVSFNVEGAHAHDVAQILDSEGVAVRAGHHCAMPLHEKLGVPATARASFHVYNNETDVDALVRGIQKVKRVFK
jgi:cysteine desulfurase/selenocysteine lyase